MTRKQEGTIYHVVITVLSIIAVIAVSLTIISESKCMELRAEIDCQQETAEECRNGQAAAWARVAELEKELDIRNGGKQ